MAEKFSNKKKNESEISVRKQVDYWAALKGPNDFPNHLSSLIKYGEDNLVIGIFMYKQGFK